MQKSDKDIPQFYACDSWTKQSKVPWNAADKRVLYPAEGIEWLAAQGAKAAEAATVAAGVAAAEIALLRTALEAKEQTSSVLRAEIQAMKDYLHESHSNNM